MPLAVRRWSTLAHLEGDTREMDFLKRLGLRMVGSAVAVVLMLGYFTVRSSCTGNSSNKELKKIPPQIWQGGTPVTVETDLSAPGVIRLSFERPRAGGDAHEYLTAWQPLGAGHHSFVISVPEHVSGMLETEVTNPPTGATASLTLDAAGKHLEDKSELTGPLEPGTAFFVQLAVDDWATARSEGE